MVVETMMCEQSSGRKYHILIIAKMVSPYITVDFCRYTSIPPVLFLICHELSLSNFFPERDQP